MKKQFPKINSLRTAALNNKMTFGQMVVLTAIILLVVGGSMYLYDPTSFNAYKHF
jgi:hypothetical protein